MGIDPESVEIDPVAVRKFRGAEFVNVGGLSPVPNRRESGTTYLHAKILWFVGSEGELLVTGSANPSKAALLSGGDWRNAEAVVVDRRRSGEGTRTRRVDRWTNGRSEGLGAGGRTTGRQATGHA